MKLYREVKVTDRLPTIEGLYIVGNDCGSFSCPFYNDYGFAQEFMDCTVIEFWLEEIELPTDEDLYNKLMIKGYTNEREIGIQMGFNFAIDKLKGV